MTSVRPAEFVVDADEPFKHDRLDRKGRVEALCRIVVELQSPAVLAVNGPFGSGKSVFLRMCAAHLQSQAADSQSQEVRVAEFNAWQQSHTRVPLVDLVATLTHSLTEAEQLGERLMKIAQVLGWRAASAATRGVIQREDFEVPADLSRFGEWKDTESRKAEFHETLAGVVDENGKLVVLIDELDRCPPERALETLDVARHLLDVPGVVVVLGVNANELHHRVKRVYGDGCDAERYLRRFIDLAVDLPGPGSNLTAFLNETSATVGLADRVGTAQSGQYSASILELLASRAELSARDIAQMMHRLAQVLALSPAPDSLSSTRWAQELTILSVCVLRSAAPDAYRRLAAGAVDGFAAAAALVEALALDQMLVEGDPVAMKVVANVAQLGHDHFAEMDAGEFKQRLVAAGIGDQATAELIAQRYVEPRHFYGRPNLGHILDLVELAV